MDEEINQAIVSFLSHGTLPVEETSKPLQEGRQRKTDMSRTIANKEEVDSRGDNYAVNENDLADTEEAIKQMPIKVEKMPGRNEPCPCGSGKKYKNCHG